MSERGVAPSAIFSNLEQWLKEPALPSGTVLSGTVFLGAVLSESFQGLKDALGELVGDEKNSKTGSEGIIGLRVKVPALKRERRRRTQIEAFDFSSHRSVHRNVFSHRNDLAVSVNFISR